MHCQLLVDSIQGGSQFANINYNILLFPCVLVAFVPGQSSYWMMSIEHYNTNASSYVRSIPFPKYPP